MIDWVGLAPYFTAVGAALGTVLWWSYRSMNARLEAQERELAAYKTHVAETYPTRVEFNNVVERVFTKLDQIYDTLSNKADR